MRWIHTFASLCLAMTAPVIAFAQITVLPGKWELTGTFKGLPFGSDGERTRTVCLSAAALETFPEKVLIDAAPPPNDDASSPPPPRCAYANVRRDGTNSTWSVSCKEPRASGMGSAIMHSSQQMEIQEKLEVKMGFISRTVQHFVRARRVGDCS